MKKTKPTWVMALFTLLMLTVGFFTAIGGLKAITNFDELSRICIIIITEIFFFGILFNVNDSEFIRDFWSEYIAIPFFTMILTASFYFFQTNVFYTYLIWVMWLFAITSAQSFFNRRGNKQKNLLDDITMFFVVLWITGFAFLTIGSFESLGLSFSKNIFDQFSFLRWTVNIKSLFTLLLVLAILIRPIFAMDWKLDEITENNEIDDSPIDTNILMVLIQSITRAFKIAGDYLNRVRLSLRAIISRYWLALVDILTEISLRTYSVFLMTFCLFSFFLLSRIADQQSTYFYTMIKSATLGDGLYSFIFVLLYTILLYSLLVLNWILVQSDFTIKSITHLKALIWGVITKKSKVLIVNVPGFLLLISIVTWLAVAIYNFIFNYPFIFPGVYTIICIFSITLFLVYKKLAPSPVRSV